MARRGRYGFERWRKEAARRARQEAKRQRQAARPRGPGGGPEIGEAPAGPPPGTWEWFSPSRGRVRSAAAGMRPPTDPPDDWILLTDVDPADPRAEPS